MSHIPALIPYPRSLHRKDGAVPADTNVTQQLDPAMAREAFRLQVAPEGISLTGGSPAALHYAQAALEQLRLQGEEIPCMDLEDQPAKAWRGFHMDSARHFIPMDELKQQIRMCAHFRLNRFHWHIADDQGWRVECRAFPALHEIGSRRQGDHFGTWKDDAEQGGYYTRDEVREIVAYCAELGIEVVPEVDMPGHVTAILAAYPQLSCTGAPVQVATRAGIFKEILCPGKDEVLDFARALWDDLLELFPGEYVHIGGDEAPKTRWKSCPHCRARMEAQGLHSEQELQGWFENQLIAHLKSRGRQVIVWNEACYGRNLDPDAIVELWWNDRDQAVEHHMRQGGRIILGKFMNCYCDYPYAMISLKSMCDLELVPEDLAEVIAEQGEERVLGSECLLWSEHIRDRDHRDSYAWPRFAASAEVGWCGSGRPDYEHFRARMETLFPIFDRYGIRATGPEGWLLPPEEAQKVLAQLRAQMTSNMEGGEGIEDIQAEI